MSYVIKNGILKKYIPLETEIVIPDGITSIWDHAFEYCRHLQTIDIPESVTHIGRSAFLVVLIFSR